MALLGIQEEGFLDLPFLLVILWLADELSRDSTEIRKRSTFSDDNIKDMVSMAGGATNT